MATLESTPQATEPDVAPRVRWRIWPVDVAWMQGIAITLLAAVSLAEQYVIHIRQRADLEEFLIAVDVDAEGNIPTWFAVVSLLACAAVLGAIAGRVRRDGGPYAGHWRGLAVLFVVLSIDELAQLHEHLGRLQSMWNTHGLFFFAWVIPGAAFVAAVGLVYARFLARLPGVTRRRFIVAALVYVAGVLGVEAIGGWRAETMGMNNMTHSVIATIEEVLEMSGVAMFLVALIRHLAGEGHHLVIDVGSKPERTP